METKLELDCESKPTTTLLNINIRLTRLAAGLRLREKKRIQTTTNQQANNAQIGTENIKKSPTRKRNSSTRFKTQ